VCGQTGRHLEIVDYRTKAWRHLDLGVNRCLLACELRRLRCQDCGVRYEAVRWARPGSPYTRARFYGLVLIGVDEISYRRGRRYLTCVADHQQGRIVWAKPGRDAATLQAFFDLLGDRRHTIKAISIDMSAGYENAINAVPEADAQFRRQVVFDPFHVCQLAAPSTTSAAPSGTSAARARPRAAAGSITPAGRS